MSNANRNILDAAIAMFSRYGVKRTSMGDLAREAGVSRQTLYNTYGNKDEVLRALIRSFTDDALNDIEARLQGATEIGDQLEIVFDRMTLAGFDLVAEMPNAEDLVDGFNRAGKEEQEASAERFRQMIERILAPHHDALTRAGLGVADLSDFIRRAAKSAGHNARDRAHLERQLHTLTQLARKAVSG